MKALTPDTLFGTRLASTTSKLLGHPTPANVGEFIKKYKSYADDLKSNAQSKIKTFYSDLLKTEKPHLSEEDYKNFKENLVDVYDVKEPSRTTTSSYSAQQERGIQNVMNAHPGVSREEVIRQLQAKGKL